MEANWNAYGNNEPRIKIIEQPTDQGVRFRYDSEQRNGDFILGENNTSSKPSYPAIQILNYRGPAYVVVSCVTKEAPYRPHPHKVVQKNVKNHDKKSAASNNKDQDSQGAVYFFQAETDDMVITFPNLGIQCVKRNEFSESLRQRQESKIDPFRTGFGADYQASIDSMWVRLCFQVFIPTNIKNKFDKVLTPVVSNPIFDRKAKSELKISYITHRVGLVSGGTEMCILCKKVAKDDIQVRFFCKKTNWEAFATLTTPHVYKMSCIVFKSPKYFDQNITEPKDVYVQLRRISDEKTSKPECFQYIPSTHAEVLKLEHGKRKGAMAAQISREAAAKIYGSLNRFVEENEMDNPQINRNCIVAKRRLNKGIEKTININGLQTPNNMQEISWNTMREAAIPKDNSDELLGSPLNSAENIDDEFPPETGLNYLDDDDVRSIIGDFMQQNTEKHHTEIGYDQDGMNYGNLCALKNGQNSTIYTEPETRYIEPTNYVQPYCANNANALHPLLANRTGNQAGDADLDCRSLHLIDFN